MKDRLGRIFIFLVIYFFFQKLLGLFGIPLTVSIIAIIVLLIMAQAAVNLLDVDKREKFVNFCSRININGWTIATMNDGHVRIANPIVIVKKIALLVWNGRQVKEEA